MRLIDLLLREDSPMPSAFLTQALRDTYGRYTGDPDPTQLAKFFHLDDADLMSVRRHNGRHQRLGFAIQLGTVRFLGVFLPNPLDVPLRVIHYMARQLTISDISILNRYLERND